MAIDLASKFSPVVDERFEVESKTSLITNKDYDFIGVKSIKIYSVGTAEMNDYGRNTNIGNEEGAVFSRYGLIKDLSTEIQEVQMEKDRSFTFVIDKMDEDETLGALNAGTALARQLREEVIPEVDKYTYAKVVSKAGKVESEELTNENAYDALVAGNEFQDEKKVPAEGRVAIVTPAYYNKLKKDKSAVLETEIGQDMKIKGVVANMDGVVIQKVVSSLLPEGVNFILAHKIATTQAIKLAEYKIHTDAVGVSGSLVEGRIYYTAFVRNNKKNAIYVSTSSDYVQTADETYQAGKTYYIKAGSLDEYEALVAGTDYEVGDDITGLVFEKIGE